jgi:hypothetical protein
MAGKKGRRMTNVSFPRVVVGALAAVALALGAWISTGTPGESVESSDTRPVAIVASGDESELTLPSWSDSFTVVPVALTPERALIPPDDINTVGIWEQGARPGAGQGAVTLVVHRDSLEQGAGPFAELEKLPLGATVELDGHNYEMVEVVDYVKERLPAETIFDQHGPEKLVIVTCGGDFDPAGNGWDSNVVATFIPSD